ncbi:methyltransferase family protein [Rhodobacter lacus]|uniref:Methyltransferase family protein n=1 Tax=Rhodobacter lacus TaxID=1641972 RepID=A0ABW5A2T0_9RHOB
MKLATTLRTALKELELPPMWLAVFAALGWAVGRLIPLPIPYADVAGWGLVALGLVISGLAAGQMVLARTTFIPRRQPARLVTSGIFALSRNPIYLADVLILSGLLLIWDALFAAPLVPLFMLWITHRYIKGEEAWIAAAHGAEYAQYCARTRRWL